MYYNSWFDYLSDSKYLVLVDLKLANTSPATITLTVCLLRGHLATLNLYMVTAGPRMYCNILITVNRKL